MRIAPSILDADWLELSKALRTCETGRADCVHLDVMDGHFVPNLTFGPALARAVCRGTSLLVEAHLMVTCASLLIEPFVKAGVKRIILHPESTPHLHRLLQQVRELGAQPGVVLNPATPLDAAQEVLGDIDLVLLMSVNPGWGGQKFIPATIDRIRRMRAAIDASGRHVELEVDGGINRETIAGAAAAGATLFVVGSAIFRATDPVAALADLARLAAD